MPKEITRNYVQAEISTALGEVQNSLGHIRQSCPRTSDGGLVSALLGLEYSREVLTNLLIDLSGKQKTA